jgi:hypothetical protein
MHDEKSRFLQKLLNEKGDLPEDNVPSYSSERQQTAQAFNLHVEKRDGMHAEGFSWGQYVGYYWTDEGSHERLLMVFGPRALEILGQYLRALVEEIRQGQLNLVRELTTAQRTQLEQSNPDHQPIIASVKSYPDLEEMLKEIKGENRREARNA